MIDPEMIDEHAAVLEVGLCAEMVTASVRGDIDTPTWPGTGRLVRLPKFGLRSISSSKSVHVRQRRIRDDQSVIGEAVASVIPAAARWGRALTKRCVSSIVSTDVILPQRRIMACMNSFS
jgi:hypothetical protein